jgi:CHRD domain-containing protein
MRRVLSLLIAGMFTLVLSAQAHAQTLTYTATLSGSNEAPPVAATGAGGFATITINVAAQTLTWVVDVYNLPSGVTAGHIHAGGAGVAGPVVVNFVVPTSASNDFRITGTAGPADVVARQPQGVNGWEDLLQAIATGHAYVNVHSQVNPGGEIRGQLVLKP